MGNEFNNSSTNVELESEKRKGKLNRSSHRYSEEDFRRLPRSEQLRLANVHWMDSKGFDESGMFQFSYTHFSNICKNLGFEKGVIDTKKDVVDLSSEQKDSRIFIDHGRREETEVKKITLSKSTVCMMDRLLEGLSNIERSKVLDVLLSDVLDEKLQDKEEGRFSVFYRPQKEERIL